MSKANMYALRDRVVVVTGGARGIGEATVRRMSDNGAAVASLDIDVVSHPAEGHAPGVLGIQCNVADEQEVATAFAEVRERLGLVDVLVNNAGINAYFDATSMQLSEWERVFAVDLRGAWLCSKHVLPEMVERGSGTIINLSSIHARMTQRGNFPYAAAKAGLEGLTRSMALDYGDRGIRVNAVAPGWTRTRLVEEWLESRPDADAAERHLASIQPLGRMADPTEVAAVICFLASDDAAAVTGATFAVDCGLAARQAT